MNVCLLALVPGIIMDHGNVHFLVLFVRLGTASKLQLHAYGFIESAIVQRASLFGDIMSIVQVPTKYLMNLHALLERMRPRKG